MVGVSAAISVAAGATGPYIAGYVFDRTGSYILAIALATALMLVGTVAVLTIKKPSEIEE